MYIKQLEVDNFKSFANKVTIPFLKGFTTISGPNGSGKSNIIDSILFALGLSTSRTLRAEKLFHLISTHTKRNEAFVKVTFGFDESDSSLKFEGDVLFGKDEFKDGNREFCVARRIRKSSSGFVSIYYLNDKVTTLSEIHLRLEKYNITPNSYNVMMQGDVTSITNCSANERRKIIDEIAGVADFDRRIDQAVQELSIVQSRIEKSSLILNEVNMRLEELFGERQQALKYQELKEKKTKLEFQINIVKFFDVKRSLELVHQSILEFNKKEQDKKEDLKALDAGLQKIRQQYYEISNLVKEKGESEQLEVKKCLEEKKGSLERKRASISFVDKNMFDNLKTVENSRNGIQTLEKKIEETELKIVQKQENISKLEEQMCNHRQDLDNILSEMKDLSQISDKYIKIRADLRRELESVKDDQMGIEKIKLPIEIELKNIKEGIERLKKNIESYESFTKDFKSNKEKLSLQLEELGKELKDFKIINENTMYELDKTRSEISDLSYNLRMAGNKIAQVEAQKMAYEEVNFGRSIDTIINSKLRGVHGPLAKLGEVDEKYAIALEIAMGSKMKFIVVDDDNVAKDAIEILKSANAGRATFLPLNKIKRAPNFLKLPKDPGVIDFAINLIDCDEIYTDAFFLALGQTLIVKDYFSAQKLIGQYRMVTCDGESFEKSGSISGGSINSRSNIKFAQSQNEELEKYKKRYRQLEQNLESLEEKRKSLESKQSQIRNGYSLSSTEFSKCKIELKNLLEKEQTLSNDLSNDKNQKIELESRIPYLENRLNDLEIQDRDFNEKLEFLQDQIQEIESKMSDSELCELKEKTQGVEDKIKSLDFRIKEQRSNINDFNRDISFNKEVIRTKREQIEKLLKDNELLRVDRDEYIEESKFLESEIKELESQIVELSKNLVKYQNERDEVYDKMLNIEKDKSTIESEIERIKEQLESFKLRRKELEPQLQEIEVQLVDQKIDIAKVEMPKESLNSIRLEISNLEKSMKELEPVNMIAIAAYDEVLSREQELKDKIQTLSNESMQIKARMQGYEKLKRDTFLMTYNKVNENFKDIFNKLSDGTGSLILESETDPFSGGLTIEAQPRDKKKQRLELMSGGEKSLTALAFVFAIQRYMPSPFYAFDEVDMHLDGINVEKLSEMIQMQSKDTQFIVVSLRKPMIESADRTIGVTQKEKGITRVTGIKLRD